MVSAACSWCRRSALLVSREGRGHTTVRLTSPHATKSRSRRTTTSAQRPEPPHRDPEPAKMSCQTYLTRGERRTRGSNENRNVCFVELSVSLADAPAPNERKSDEHKRDII